MTDLRAGLPVADASVSVLLNVFSPRNAAEYRRVLRRDGLLLVVTPAAEHLGELVDALGLITVDADKPGRLRRALGAAFAETGVHPLRLPLELGHQEIADVVLMGPNAHHVDPAVLRERIARLPEPFAVCASFTVTSMTRVD